ncbi:hypothetical protein [Planobispora longispora]|uniref:Uncharacterized protein n=1 Tax=Planobispora longispora TaxID=28887 RepID=A0A8J3W4X2_9ACTN|nr:hypothetical protein [Planobispora longispora]BFE86198.1 hypothetical protein GCM10020093_087990 [Planobispora longispora]GIH75858.1 hypothetical protein Plo01_22870 [Planobispora longispora]
MISLRPIAGFALAAALLSGYAAAPASAATAPSTQESAVSSAETAARPKNGKILYAGISGGRGVLKIKNGTRKDGVVTLVRGKKKAISIYVRARSTASIKTVRGGTYRIYFTTGYRFSVSKGRFASAASYQRFNDKLKFVSTSTAWSVWTLTLNAVPGGNASTSGVNPKDFPA